MSSSSYMLVEDVAVLLGCSKRTVHERARLGEIPHRRPPSARRLLFLEAELREWLDGASLERVELPRGGRVVNIEAGHRLPPPQSLRQMGDIARPTATFFTLRPTCPVLTARAVADSLATLNALDVIDERLIAPPRAS